MTFVQVLDGRSFPMTEGERQTAVEMIGYLINLINSRPIPVQSWRDRLNSVHRMTVLPEPGEDRLRMIAVEVDTLYRFWNDQHLMAEKKIKGKELVRAFETQVAMRGCFPGMSWSTGMKA